MVFILINKGWAIFRAIFSQTHMVTLLMGYYAFRQCPRNNSIENDEKYVGRYANAAYIHIAVE
jgi:hypothetical protein